MWWQCCLGNEKVKHGGGEECGVSDLRGGAESILVEHAASGAFAVSVYRIYIRQAIFILDIALVLVILCFVSLPALLLPLEAKESHLAPQASCLSFRATARPHSRIALLLK